jgi:hypothetical protein
MYDLATFGVDTEDIYGLTKFFRLKYNSLKNLRRSQVYPALRMRGLSTFALPSTSIIARYASACGFLWKYAPTVSIALIGMLS